MTDSKDTKKQLVLKDISDTSALPVLTEGALAGCFLVNAVDITVPSPRLPKIVENNWYWQGTEQELSLNNLWVAVDAAWAGDRKLAQDITLSEAIYDIFTLCGLCVVGVRGGLKKSLVRAVKKKAFIKADMLYHDGRGFENGTHPAVLLIRRDRKTDKAILSVIGDVEESISFDLENDKTPSPLDNIVAFPAKK
ncbi:hypothetical protein [Nereida sp. NH-UV-3]|uniref:hypothetical protein n=1 Tax=Nereida TaxID=282198 RepID=UPI0036F23910